MLKTKQVTQETTKTVPDIKGTIDALKEEGWQVKVYHGRLHSNGNDVKLMSRGEFKTNPIEGYEVQSRGGFTHICLERDGEKRVGKVNVPPTKLFHRKVQLVKALSRATKGL